MDYRLLSNKKIGLIVLAFAPYLVALGMQVFFSKQLSVEEVGVFALVWLFLSMVLNLSNWNADKYIISKKDISKDEIDEVFTFEIIVSIALYLITVFFFRDVVNGYIDIKDSTLFWVAVGFMFCYYPLTRTRAILEKRLSYVAAYSPIFISNIIAAIIGGVCIFQGFGLWSMVIWKISTHLIEVLILFFVSPYIPRLRFNLLHNSDILSYCLPLFVGGAIGFIILNVDRMLVTSFLGERELGLYHLAFTLSHTPFILRELIARFLLPIFSKQDCNEKKIQIFGKLNGILQIFSVLSAILVTYWSDVLFQLVFGEKWSDAVPIFVVLYYAALYKLVGGFSVTLLSSVMRTRVAFDVSVLNLVVSVPILFLTIKFSGLSGAAIGVLVSIVVVTIIMYETSVKNFCNFGFLYYLSYLSVNFTSLYIIFTFWIDNSDGVMVRVLATLVSLAFAVITLPINSVLKRAFPKLLSTNSKV